VTTAPARSNGASSGAKPGTSPGAPSTSRWPAPCAAERLTVHRDRASSLVGAVAVGQPRADRAGQGLGVHAAQRPADGGLGRHRPVLGCLAAGAQRGPDHLRGIASPLGDRCQGSGTGENRRGGHGQDRDQRVAAATASPRVADRGEVSQQVRRLGWLERLGVGELGQGGWDRG